MKIRQVGIYKSPIKLKEPFIISLGPVEFADNVIIVIRTDSGLTGYGECSPFMSITGESGETACVVGRYLATGLLGKNPLNIGECCSVMDKIIYGNSCIKSAFDIALHDISSQHAGLPLYSFLGGKNDKDLITDYTVSIGEPEKMALDALKIRQNGFKVIKVKVGNSGTKDVARIKAIRQLIGNDIPLRLDANQGWVVDEAIETLNNLSHMNIQFCEEPIARWNYMQLSKIKDKSSIPIMADESCCDHHDAERLAGMAACNSFNIKLAKSGGLMNAVKIVKIAERAGLNLQVGGFLESRLGFTASAHLALISDNIRWCDFDTPLMHTEDHIAGGIQYSTGGVVSVPETPGLGASVDDACLAGLSGSLIE